MEDRWHLFYWDESTLSSLKYFGLLLVSSLNHGWGTHFLSLLCSSSFDFLTCVSTAEEWRCTNVISAEYGIHKMKGMCYTGPTIQTRNTITNGSLISFIPITPKQQEFWQQLLVRPVVSLCSVVNVHLFEWFEKHMRTPPVTPLTRKWDHTYTIDIVSATGQPKNTGAQPQSFTLMKKDTNKLKTKVKWLNSYSDTCSVHCKNVSGNFFKYSTAALFDLDISSSLWLNHSSSQELASFPSFQRQVSKWKDMF